MRADQIGIQLYTLRERTRTDMIGTLLRVADLGYSAVEFAGFGNATPAEIRATLSQTGIIPLAAHVALERICKEPDEVLDELDSIACHRPVVPWIPPELRPTGSGDLEAVLSCIGKFAALASERGQRVAYHNHSFEFEPLDGSTLWDTLLHRLPTLELEIDVYWVAVAARSPAKLIRDCGERVRLLHMKDRSAGVNAGMATPGEGDLPWPDIIAAGRQAGVEWYVFEQDDAADPITAAGRALQYLRSMSAAAIR
jgi:sugar phosphate isomerase/epimerase